MHEGKENGPVGPDQVLERVGGWSKPLFRQNGGIQSPKIGGEPEHGEHVNGPLGRIEVVPAGTIPVIARIGVVIIMVPFAETHKRDEPAVTAAIAPTVWLRAEHMAQRIDSEGGIQHHEHPEHAGEKKTADSADDPAVKTTQDERKG